MDRWVRWALPGAVAVYCLWATLLILQRPGLQYDEALLVSGPVHMLNSPQEINLPHDPDTWVCALGHCFPLMTTRYVGPIKEYLCLPLFRVFGARTVMIRFVSMFLAALGIWGIAGMIGQHVSPRAGVAVALVLAINPAYADLTVFDNNAVAPMMAALGLLCLAISGYLRRRTARAALWVGAAMAFGIWARANYVWLAVALCAAVLIVLRKRVLEAPVSHWLAGTAGGILAGAPFLAYQIYSKGGTWEGMSMFVSQSSFGERIYVRLVQLSEVLLSDREHRAMWNGPAMPDWQRYLFLAMVVSACLLAFLLRPRDDRYSLWSRITAVTFLLFSALLITSRMQVAEHHLITLVPVACVLVVLAGAMLIRRYRWGLAIAAALGAVYLGSASYWQISAIRGLAATGGVGVWSDAIYPLAADLRENYPNRQIKILDWGLQNNLYVLTQGKLRTVEIYPDESHRPWFEEIREGGVFLLSAPENRQFPDAPAEFLRALAASRPSMRRYAVMQRNHTGYAEIIEIKPNTAGKVPQEAPAASGLSSTITTADARYERQLSGFYQIEESSWRWTRRQFSIALGAPGLSGESGAQLTVKLYVPDSVIRKLGGVTLTAQVGGHVLAPETYRQSGSYSFKRDLQAAWLNPEANTFEFALDKSLPPSANDSRELGIVVVGASLEPK